MTSGIHPPRSLRPVGHSRLPRAPTSHPWGSTIRSFVCFGNRRNKWAWFLSARAQGMWNKPASYRGGTFSTFDLLSNHYVSAQHEAQSIIMCVGLSSLLCCTGFQAPTTATEVEVCKSDWSWTFTTLRAITINREFATYFALSVLFGNRSLSLTKFWQRHTFNDTKTKLQAIINCDWFSTWYYFIDTFSFRKIRNWDISNATRKCRSCTLIVLL